MGRHLQQCVLFLVNQTNKISAYAQYVLWLGTFLLWTNRVNNWVDWDSSVFEKQLQCEGVKCEPHQEYEVEVFLSCLEEISSGEFWCPVTMGVSAHASCAGEVIFKRCRSQNKKNRTHVYFFENYLTHISFDYYARIRVMWFLKGVHVCCASDHAIYTF